MAISRFKETLTEGVLPFANGEFVRYDDHHDEVVRLKEVINSLYNQLSEVSNLKLEVEKLKPSQKSKFIVMYKTEGGGYEHTIKYQRWFNHAVERVNKLQKDPDVFDVRAYALVEVPIVPSLTLQLPE